MKKTKMSLIILIVFLSIGLMGCAGTFTGDPGLVGNNEEQPREKGAELSLEIPAQTKVYTEVDVMQNIGWVISNTGTEESGRFQVNYTARNSYAHHNGYGSYSNATFGQGTGMSRLPAGGSYANVDMSGFGETGYYGKYLLDACIVPDYYSEEEGEHNDANPNNNCATREIVVLNSQATESHVIANGIGPYWIDVNPGDEVKKLGFEALNVGVSTATDYRVNVLIYPYEIYTVPTNSDWRTESVEFNYNFKNLESGKSHTFENVGDGKLKFAHGRWHIRTCVYNTLIDGSADKRCDTIRAFNVGERP